MDELSNPWQASSVSLFAFSGGALLPLLAALAANLAGAPQAGMKGAIIASTTVGLLLFGCLGARLGGASALKGGGRVLVGGWLAMAASFGVGSLFGVDV